MIQPAEFTYSPFSKAFEQQIRIEEQEEKQLKELEEHRKQLIKLKDEKESLTHSKQKDPANK